MKSLGGICVIFLIEKLVKHSVTEVGEGEEQGFLQDQEIIGNTLIFLIAGHETT